MKLILYGGVLLLATAALAQQVPPYSSPPHSTPPTFPPDQAPRVPPSAQSPQYPPEPAPSQTERPSASALESTIMQQLAAEPLLRNAHFDVKVTARDVTVSGTVDDQRQHEFALHIAQSNAGDRQVVDKIKVRS